MKYYPYLTLSPNPPCSISWLVGLSGSIMWLNIFDKWNISLLTYKFCIEPSLQRVPSGVIEPKVEPSPAITLSCEIERLFCGCIKCIVSGNVLCSLWSCHLQWRRRCQHWSNAFEIEQCSDCGDDDRREPWRHSAGCIVSPSERPW